VDASGPALGVSFDRLQDADLTVARNYIGGRAGNSDDDPIARRHCSRTAGRAAVPVVHQRRYAPRHAHPRTARAMRCQLTPDDDLQAIWRSKDGLRFQNYQARFTVLDLGAVSRTWVTDLLAGASQRP
jgi:hypothetical protein